MSKLIRQLLQEHDPLFSVGLARLEQASGNSGIDVKLTADILSMVRVKMRDLGLDPSDTTGAELFAALSARAKEAEQSVAAYLGHPASLDEAAVGIEKLCSELIGTRPVWRLKPASVKRLFTSNPPKKVMKTFHFQSLDSFNKRMDPCEAMLAARIVESKTWWQKTHKLIRECSSKDFEAGSVSVRAMTDARWTALLSEYSQAKGHAVLAVKECGLVGFAVLPCALPMLSAAYNCLYQANEIRVFGSFMKLHFVNPSLGHVLVDGLDDGGLVTNSISGHSVHWRDIQRYYGLHGYSQEEQFAHLDTHDFGWIKTETLLATKVHDLAFWLGTELLGVSYGDNRIVSMHVLDVIDSVNVGLSYQSMYTRQLARSLRSELMARYLYHPVARALAIKQFDISALDQENW